MEIPTFSMSPSSNVPSPDELFTHDTLRDQPITSRLAMRLVINLSVSFINLCIISGSRV